MVPVLLKVTVSGELLSPSQLEKEYQDWVLQMHMQYDEEAVEGEDQPVIIVSRVNTNDNGIFGYSHG